MKEYEIEEHLKMYFHSLQEIKLFWTRTMKSNI